MAYMFSCSSFSSSWLGWNYDIFLSFRGKDTRKNFMGHLYTALVQAGIHTFRDDNELSKGDDILRILNAIQQSKISIVVFSKGYASSAWCLDELSKIMECKRTIGQIVLPVFYDIDPSHVRQQTGPFAAAFAKHEKQFNDELEKVSRWKGALAEASNLSGWDLRSTVHGHESKFIQMIVEDVLTKLDRKYLYVAKHPVGIDSRVRRLLFLLNTDTNDDVHIVGIHGMGGLGKTTIAKAVFNELYNVFEGSCFLFNVKDISKEPNGQVKLQNQLLCDILRIHDLKINNVDGGINLIEERFWNKKVLLVIDDVDELEQLDILVGKRSWFGSGSRIIITTRDERLLTQFEVDEKHQIAEMNKEESLELLNWHAFKENHITEDYAVLLNKAMNYCGGLPLALEVLGSYLYKRSKVEWRSAIEKLQIIPNDQIQKKLRISYDTLNDDTLKDIFLDVACFFVGRERYYIEKILDARGFFPEVGINVLIERSLIVSHQNKIDMHDLLRDMGREIVRERSPDRPGERSRIWLHEDAWNILQMQMGTNRVEGLILDLQQQSKVVCLSTKSFEQMNCLKLLQVDGLRLTGCYGHFSKELMWLCWHKCPLRSLPSDLELDNLSVLDMQHSNSKKLWKGTKFLNKLKILNLSYSKLLTMTPNLHSSSLEKLILEGCSGLIKVHQSIGHFERLVTLNLRGCYRLVDLPKSICCLKSLETLDVTQCSKLEKLPEQLGDMESLTELLVGETAIKQLPSSIGNLKNLRTLSLGKCNYNLDSPSRSWLLSMISSCLSPRSANTKAFQPPSFAGLSSLRSLSLSYCGLSEDAISSTDFSSFSCLEEMNLKGNKFFNLPCGIGCLPMLRYLVVEDCKNLLSISELPTSLMHLYAGNCTSLERIFLRSRGTQGIGLDFSGCEKLLEIQDSEIVTWRRMAHDSTKSHFQAYNNGKYYEMIFPICEIPDWFSHVGDMYSSILSFHVPAASEFELRALLVWVSLELKGQKDIWFFPLIKAVLIARLKSSGTHLFTYPIYLSIDSQSWVGYIKSVENDCHQWIPIGRLCSWEGGDEWELSVNISEAYVVKRVGVCMEMENMKS